MKNGGEMINKIVLTKGAIFDYEDIVCKTEMDRQKFRTAVEKALSKDRYADETDLRLPLTDKSTGKELLLFIKRGYDFGIMRTWILRGICEQSDYDEEMEHNGVIKEWLEVEIE